MARMMTIPNYITVLRILLIPLFVAAIMYYGQSVKEADPQEWLRWLAISIFVLASVSDGVDGYLARKFNLQSLLGRILDPIADKGLLITALIALSLSNWPNPLPIWFPVLVIGRDVVILTGCIVIYLVHGKIEIAPSLVGKMATALQMVVISWAMLQVPYIIIPLILAGIATFVSGIRYIWDAIKSLHPTPEAHD